MFGCDGIMASELIRQLQELIDQHGDQQVIAGGTDYPDGVGCVEYVDERKADGYKPLGTFHIIS